MPQEKKRFNFFAKLAILAFFVLCVVTFTGQRLTYSSLQEKEAQLVRQKSDIERELEQIQDELDRPFDEDYIKDVAREKLGYHMPNEIIFYNDLTK